MSNIEPKKISVVFEMMKYDTPNKNQRIYKPKKISLIKRIFNKLFKKKSIGIKFNQHDSVYKLFKEWQEGLIKEDK